MWELHHLFYLALKNHTAQLYHIIFFRSKSLKSSHIQGARTCTSPFDVRSVRELVNMFLKLQTLFSLCYFLSADFAIFFFILDIFLCHLLFIGQIFIFMTGALKIYKCVKEFVYSDLYCDLVGLFKWRNFKIFLGISF